MTTGDVEAAPGGAGGVGVDEDLQDLLRREREALGAAVEGPELQATIDALATELVLLDERGRIIMVNRAWRRFSAENDPAARDFVGDSYLAACSATAEDGGDAQAFARGLRDLFSGRRDRFELEYPCHTPTEQRWFMARAARFTSGGLARVVVTHENVTVRRQSEERYRHIARTLQAALLPGALPEAPGLELAARYRAQGEGLDVGGDFYDVFRDDDDWVLVVGDVCGKGPEAAALTAEARWTIRALATSARPPDAVLRSANRALANRDDFAFLTAVVARVTPDPDGARVVCGRAGHPVPLVVRAGGDVEPVPAVGGLLGVFEDVRFEQAEVRLSPGDSLVIVTDGVTEARDGPRELGPEGVRAVLAEASGLGARALARRLERATIAFSDGPLRDDLAIVVARAASSPASEPPMDVVR